jgi:hypothetical protein
MKKIMNMAAVLTAAICLILPLFPAQAADNGLYAAAPPAGSAFVRFINADAAAPSVTRIRGKTYKAAPLGEIGAYIPVPEGTALISLGDATAETQLKPGAHYSAVLAKDNLTVIEEPAYSDRLKTQIILINASDKPAVTLKTADGATGVIEAVPPGKVGARAVNPVKIGFSLYADSGKIDAIEPVLLERGSEYAVLVYNDASGKPAVNYGKAEGL